MNFVRIVGAQSAERFADIIKDPVAPCMRRAPANEQRSGAAAVSTVRCGFANGASRTENITTSIRLSLRAA